MFLLSQRDTWFPRLLRYASLRQGLYRQILASSHLLRDTAGFLLDSRKTRCSWFRGIEEEGWEEGVSRKKCIEEKDGWWWLRYKWLLLCNLDVDVRILMRICRKILVLHHKGMRDMCHVRVGVCFDPTHVLRRRISFPSKSVLEILSLNCNASFLQSLVCHSRHWNKTGSWTCSDVRKKKIFNPTSLRLMLVSWDCTRGPLWIRRSRTLVT